MARDAGAHAVALQQDHRTAAARQLQRGGDARDPAADHTGVDLQVGGQRGGSEAGGLGPVQPQRARSAGKLVGDHGPALPASGLRQARRPRRVRTDELIDGLEGKKTAIREMARETKGEAVEMMKTYLADEEEALDGFEFLSMAEAGELCPWEIVAKMSETIGAEDVRGLAGWAVGVQREHVESVRRASLTLAAKEAAG